MENNNYSLKQIKDYAASKVSKAVGYTMLFFGGLNLGLDAVQKDIDEGTVINSIAILGGLILASGLENKLKKRDKISREITNKTLY